MLRSIVISGARTHNLKNISLEFPHGKISVVTGVSGSGKSSLVFDTLYAEGQRRYVQSLSTYARLFLERLERPDVDAISRIPPAIALRQKNTIKNARSTVGTVTEINDYLRLLYATVGWTFCPKCGEEVRSDSVPEAASRVLATPGMYIFLAPLHIGSRSLAETAAWLEQTGYHRLYDAGATIDAGELVERFDQAATLPASLMTLIDRVSIGDGTQAERVREALEKAFEFGGGRCRVVRVERQNGNFSELLAYDFDRRFNCARCQIGFPELRPALFSPNSPIGACPECEGFGRTVELDLEKVIPNANLSLRQALIAPWRTPAYREMNDWMLRLARRRKIRTTAPFREMTAEERSWLLDGEPGRGFQEDRWPGVHGFFKWLESRRYKTHVRILLAKYRRFVPCPVCGGTKLKPEALNVKIDDLTIADAGRLSIENLSAWIRKLARRKAIATRAATILRELGGRVGYLKEVGLSYLTLERQARTLSGGEAQRIHLASALGSQLVGTLYALDEPTVGLHSSDARRLLAVLRHLRDMGNTVVVVEHDPIIIDGADFAIELGPGGGSEGGSLLYADAPESGAIKSACGTPGRVLLMRALARERRFTRRDSAIRIQGAREHNLKQVDVAIPLGRVVCVTGVSGSGKSTLVRDVLYGNYLRYRGEPVEAGRCDRIEGLDQIGAMIHMSQELPTRSLRSNPATYLKIYDDIRKLFASTSEARRQGIQSRHFSFNVSGGRCERCNGTGTVTIEMHFMADLEVQCDVCEGRRFQSHILGIRYRNLNIDDVLDLTVDDAARFFAHVPAITRRLEALSSVGLGYIRLGQTTSTLSGGEAQRLKIARFLLADLEPAPIGRNGKTLPRMFLLDEPTTGLSSVDNRKLIRVLQRLAAEGNTVVVIEHNVELIAHSDYVIDLGPGGGDQGGKLVVSGSPVQVAASGRSITGRELRRLFGLRAAATTSREIKAEISSAAHA